MGTFQNIEKKESISYQDFIEQHLKKRIPLVFKNATGAWKSNTMFTPQFFKENFGSYQTSHGERTYTMSEIIDLTAKSTAENPAPYPILFEIPEQIPELLKLLEPLHMNYAQPNWFRSGVIPYGKFGNNIHLFIGGKGNQYSLHKDFYHTNAWITQLYGQKKFILFPDGQDEYLYAGKEGMSRYLSPVNVVSPDFQKYPLYKNASPLEVVLQPGETIFVPNGIWHTTVASEQNISLIFDQLNGQNYPAWKKDLFEIKLQESKIKAALHYAFALSAGALCKAKALTGAKF
jgi:hypothetical protein